MTVTKFLIMEIHIKMTEDALCTKKCASSHNSENLTFFHKEQ